VTLTRAERICSAHQIYAVCIVVLLVSENDQHGRRGPAVQVGNSSRFFAVPLLRGSFFTSSLLNPFVAWLLAWACAMAMRMSFNRRRA